MNSIRWYRFTPAKKSSQTEFIEWDQHVGEILNALCLGEVQEESIFKPEGVFERDRKAVAEVWNITAHKHMLEGGHSFLLSFQNSAHITPQMGAQHTKGTHIHRSELHRIESQLSEKS